MRLRSVRLALWQLMAFVAVEAMILGVAIELKQRRTRFLRLAAYHRSQVIAPEQQVDHNRRVVRWIDRDGGMLVERPRLDYWHEELAHKYQAASARPWYPVEPDPPAPRPGEPLSATNKKMWPDPFAPARASSTMR
jgi:hypothetical protein